MDISQDLKIRDIIGEEKYILLMKNFGGSNLYIEKYETHQRNERNQKIKKLSRQGLQIDSYQIDLIFLYSRLEIF